MLRLGGPGRERTLSIAVKISLSITPLISTPVLNFLTDLWKSCAFYEHAYIWYWMTTWKVLLFNFYSTERRCEGRWSYAIISNQFCTCMDWWILMLCATMWFWLLFFLCLFIFVTDAQTLLFGWIWRCRQLQKGIFSFGAKFIRYVSEMCLYVLLMMCTWRWHAYND